MLDFDKIYKDAFDNAPFGILYSSADGKLLQSNKAMAEILGYQSSAELAVNITDIAEQIYSHPFERKEMLLELLAVDGWVWGERIFIDAAGNAVGVRLTARAVRDGNGQFLCFEKIVEKMAVRDDAYKTLAAANASLQGLLEQRNYELNMSARKLEEVNTALRVLLEHREADKQEREEAILTNVKKTILPYLDKLKASHLDKEQEAYVDVLETHIMSMVSPFIQRLSQEFVGLSPKEVQIAGLIREGKTTKEIANLMCLSENTINTHRFRLRKKLRIRGKSVNLHSFLYSVDK